MMKAEELDALYELATQCIVNEGHLTPAEDVVMAHVHLYWTDVQQTMRYALEERSYSDSGLLAHARLQAVMDAPSWDNLQSLWDRWPHAVIELSVYDRPVGMDALNTVFWEVREY